MEQYRPNASSRRQWLARLAGKKGASKIGPLRETFSPDQPMYDQPVDEAAGEWAPLELPPISDALLDRDELAGLFRDLDAFATDLEFAIPRRPGQTPPSASAARATLAGIRDQLLAPNVASRQKFQIRYRWNGQRWIDTIERRENGFRLVRIAHPDQA